MTKDDAKRILLAHMPSSGEPEDPEMAEALALARADADLEAWLEQQTAFNSSVRAALRDLPAPAGLRESILARHRVIVPLWRRPEFLAVAACVALTLVIAALWARQLPSWTQKSTEEDYGFTGFRSRMVSFAVRTYRMDIVTNDLNQVESFLRSQGAPTELVLTPGLNAMPVKGGAKLSWQGHPVAMVCFNMTANQTLYMFVMDATAVQRGKPPGPNPVVAAIGGLTTASWSREGKVYLVAAAADPAALQQLLGIPLARGQPPPSLVIRARPSAGSIMRIVVHTRPSQQPIEIDALIFV